MSKGKVTCGMPAAALPSSFISIMLLLSASLVGVIAFFFPWIRVSIIAQRLPEARFVLLDQAQTPYPFGALPEVKMRHQQACRAAMLRLQGLSLIGVDHPGLPTQHLLQRQVGGIAPIAEGTHLAGVIRELREQAGGGATFPGGAKHRPTVHALK